MNNLLTRREREVMEQVKQGLSTLEIAEELEISPRTVQSHLYHIMSKLSVRSRVKALIALGLIAKPSRERRH